MAPEFGPGDIVWFGTRLIFVVDNEVGLTIANGGPHGFPDQDEELKWNMKYDDLHWQSIPEERRFSFGWYPINIGDHPYNWSSHVGFHSLKIPDYVQRYMVEAIFNQYMSR